MLAMIDVSNIQIETDRLILRPWHESDLSDLNEYARVDGVGPMAGWMPHKTMEESRTILRYFINDKKTFALELKENGKVIGSIGLEEFEPNDIHGDELQGREVGYVLSKEYWGRGLMPEAVKGVIDYCFHVLGYDYVTCSHFQRNNQSRRVIEKCGFHFLEESYFDTRYATRESTRYYVLYNPNLKR